MTAAEELLLRWADERPSPVFIVRTHRLARLLKLRIAELRERDGAAVAETPDILTIDQWVQRAWEQTSPRELLLPEAAELALWERIVTSDPAGDVLDSAAVARECAAAWRLVHQWSEPEWDSEALSPESEAFRRWMTTMRQRGAESAWVTAAQLPSLLIAVLHAHRPGPLPPAMIFVGYERFEPYVVRLRDALQKCGTQMREHELQPEPAALHVRAFATVQDEARTIAREIRDRIETGDGARIGVLATDLERYREPLELALTEELDPASVLSDAEPRPRPFDLAVAPSLDRHAVIAHALDLLELRREANPRSLLSRVLLAPYPRPDGEGDAARELDEREGRAMTEAALRRRNVSALDLAELARRLRVGAPRFSRRLDALAAHLEKPRTDAGPAAIVQRFIARLQAAGWPGSHLQGDEGIAFTRWRDVLASLAALEVVEPVMSEERALVRLRELCTRTSVQSPSAGLQVQVMSLLDSAGLTFDGIYVVGMDSVSFPAPLRPNALLPARWQREQRLPLASADAELEFARAVWTRVLRSASQVQASFAIGGEGDEMRSAGSFIAAEAARADAARTAEPPWYAAQAARALEPRPPETPVAALVRSGPTTLLVAQSRCPFQAMAAIRLAADALEAEQSEPAGNTRGTLVHEALGHVLPRIGSREGLLLSTEQRIAELSAEAADHALASEKSAAVPEPLRAATRHWLQGILGAWLLYERDNRSGDWKFEMAEQRFLASFAAGDGGEDVRITCVVDRIDVIEGGRVLIDYKTGSAVHRAVEWHGARPDDAQLPIYAVAVGEALTDKPVAGLAFARLDTREKLELVGRCDVEQAKGFGPPGTRHADRSDWTGWSAALGQMKQALGALAVSFARGEVAVDPLRDANTCRNCRRQRLCRVFEGTVGEDEDGAGEEA